MAQILMLTDRPQEDEQVTAFAVELAHLLEMDGLAAVVARHWHTVLSTLLCLGTLDGGLLPQSMPLLVASANIDTVATRRLFTACHRSAAFFGLKCETGRANQSLAETAVALGGFYKLLVISRDTVRKTLVENMTPPFVGSELATPLMICPERPEPWRRVVVAARDGSNRASLLAWGQYWSDRLDIPMTVMNLNSTASRPVWSKLAVWLSRTSAPHRRELIRERLRTCSLQADDLLLVERQPALRPVDGGLCEISLEDLITATDLAIAVAPTSFCSQAWHVPVPSPVESAA